MCAGIGLFRIVPSLRHFISGEFTGFESIFRFFVDRDGKENKFPHLGLDLSLQVFNHTNFLKSATELLCRGAAALRATSTSTVYGTSIQYVCVYG